MHPVAIPLLHQHSACSLENAIAIVGNSRFGPPFPSNTASIWTGSKNLDAGEVPLFPGKMCWQWGKAANCQRPWEQKGVAAV